MLPSQPAGWAGRNGGGSQSGSRIETEKASGSAKSRLSDVLMYSSIYAIEYRRFGLHPRSGHSRGYMGSLRMALLGF